MPDIDETPLSAEQHEALVALLNYLVFSKDVKAATIYGAASINCTQYDNYRRGKSENFVYGNALRRSIRHIVITRHNEFADWAKAIAYVVFEQDNMTSASDLLKDTLLPHVDVTHDNIESFINLYRGIYDVIRFAGHLDEDDVVDEPNTRVSDLLRQLTHGRTSSEWSPEDFKAIDKWSDQQLRDLFQEERQKIVANVVWAMMDISSQRAALPCFTIKYRRKKARRISNISGVILPIGDMLYFYGNESGTHYPLIIATERTYDPADKLRGLVLRRQGGPPSVLFASRVVIRKRAGTEITNEDEERIGIHKETEVQEDIAELKDDMYNRVRLYGKGPLR